MQLKVGRRYIRRDGDVSRAVAFDASHETYPYVAGEHLYTGGGRWHIFAPSVNDLLAVATPLYVLLTDAKSLT